MYEKYQSLADRYVKGNGKVLKDQNPSTGKTIAEFKMMDENDLKRSIELCTDAFSKWSSLSPFKRGLILLKAGEAMERQVEEFSKLMTIEEGKPLNDSRLEVVRSYNTLKFYGAIAMKYGGKTIPSSSDNTAILTFREPLGLVGLISPWNFPLSIPVWKMAPALAAGNVVVIKPASSTPLIVAKLLDSLLEGGLPEDVVTLAVGSGDTIGNGIVESEDVKAVSFTGSVPVGRGIYKRVGKKNTMTRIQLELGGKNAMYVDEHADLELAVKNSIVGSFGLTGQSCTATSRLLVHTRVYDEFRRKFTNAVKNWKTGDGLGKETNMGPVVDENQLKVDLGYINTGIAEGARLISGNAKARKNSLFLEPVIFDSVAPDMRLFKEEIFGPVAGITPVRDIDEAIELANSVVYGHTSGIMTSSISNAMEYVRRVEAGVIKVNRPTVGLELQAPFGAFKGSGANTWKEMGEEALDFYSKQKTTYLGW